VLVHLLLRQSVEIVPKFTQTTGRQLPHLRAARQNYAALLDAMGFSQPEVLAKLNEVAAPFGIRLGPP
jgi:hypothetical protein